MKLNGLPYESTKDVSREEWLEMRRKGVGGSDASAIMGQSPWSSPLKVYMEKVGEVEPNESSEAMRQGTDLEEYVAKRFCEYMEENGIPTKVERVNRILIHPKYPWMRANIDRNVVGVDAGLECKTTSAYNKTDFSGGEISPHYFWQVQHYMAVTGASHWYLAVLVLGQAFYVFDVPRNDEMIDTLISYEKEFWEEHVEKKDPPLPIGSEYDDTVISESYPVSESGTSADLFEFEADLDLRNLKLRAIDDLRAGIAEIDQRIKTAMKTAESGVSGGWRITWKSHNVSRLDTKKLREEHPDLYAQYSKETTERKYIVRREKDGE